MQRFIVLYRAPQNVAERFAQASPEEAQEGVKLWVNWAAKLGPALLEPGKPLGNAVNVRPTGTTKSDTDIIGTSNPHGAMRPGGPRSAGSGVESARPRHRSRVSHAVAILSVHEP